MLLCFYGPFFFQAEDGIRDGRVTGVQTCALPISGTRKRKRPSCGTRFSAMSSSAMTLMRDRIELWNRLAIGRIATCRSEERRVGKECGYWCALARWTRHV